MISIVICSANAQALDQVKRNIQNTIGVPYEIISFNNSDGKKGICELYNAGTKVGKYDLLCFMHEDIEFITEQWGETVVSLFNADARLGLVGVAGGGYKSLTPSSWYNYDLEINGGFYCNLIQGFKYTDKADAHDYRNPKNEKSAEVACVDGCWLCTRKIIALQNPFDEKMLSQFHGYDIDFSLSVGRTHKVMVTYEILLKHFSEGKFNKIWMEEIVKVHKKWSHILPVNIDNLPENRLKQIERNAFEIFLQQSLQKEYFSKIQLLKIIWSTRKSRIATLSFPYKLFQKLKKLT